MQMTDRFSCFSENSVSFLQPSSSNPSSGSLHSSTSIQNAVTLVYKTTSSTSHKPLYLTLSWFRSLGLGQSSLTICFGPNTDPASPSSLSFKLISSSSRLFKKNKGSRRIELDKSRIEVFWDFSNARFDRKPEPVDGFYLLVVVDSELGLFLGDMVVEGVEKKLKYWDRKAPKFSLISRREHCSGHDLYRTRCQFDKNSAEHEIMIRVSGAEGINEDPILLVYIDKKKVMRVKRLQWNFRGSQTIFLDGTNLMIDMLWDVHDWFFSEASEGRGVFMFTTRSGLLDGKFWLEDAENKKLVDKLEIDHRADDFSLFIYATKNS